MVVYLAVVLSTARYYILLSNEKPNRPTTLALEDNAPTEERRLVIVRWSYSGPVLFFRSCAVVDSTEKARNPVVFNCVQEINGNLALFVPWCPELSCKWWCWLGGLITGSFCCYCCCWREGGLHNNEQPEVHIQLQLQRVQSQSQGGEIFYIELKRRTW